MLILTHFYYAVRNSKVKFWAGLTMLILLEKEAGSGDFFFSRCFCTMGYPQIPLKTPIFLVAQKTFMGFVSNLCY
jgi:hypothetical protein